MSHLNFWIVAFSTNFYPIKIDLSGNTVWLQASAFQKLAKLDHFWAFIINFCPLRMLNETIPVIFKHRVVSFFPFILVKLEEMYKN